MNGKYWDPEKYFDIVQFPGEFEEIQNLHAKPYQKSKYRVNSNNGYYKKQARKQTSNGSFDNGVPTSPTSSLSLMPPPPAPMMGSESPQALLVPRNSPKDPQAKLKNQKKSQKNTAPVDLSTSSANSSDQSFQNMSAPVLSEQKPASSKNQIKNNKKKASILSSLGLDLGNNNTVDSSILSMSSVEGNSSNMGRNLLDMIKPQQVEPSVNILDLINNNTQKPKVSPKQKNNKSPLPKSKSSILDNLFDKSGQETAKQAAMRPRLLTAQELEMSQFSEQKRQTDSASLSLHQSASHWNKSELERLISMENKQSNDYEQQSSMNMSSASESDMAMLAGDAYKQLVHNLDNHPLSGAARAPSHINNLIKKMQASKPTAVVAPNTSSTNQESSNMLKMMLKVNTSPSTSPNGAESKKAVNKTKKQKSPKTSPKYAQQQQSFESEGQSQQQQFQDYYQVGNNRVNLENAVHSALHQALAKPQSPPAKNLYSKIKQPEQRDMRAIEEQNHFNSLINKIKIPSEQLNLQQLHNSASESSNILKWFTNNTRNGVNHMNNDNFSMASLNEIEFVENHRRPQANQLY